MSVSAQAPSGDTEDFTLIDEWLAGDEAAFGRIFEKYKQKIYKLVYRFVQNPEEAEDL
jgi:DNA-directed RNA polymerase specialized sigma24 family protein